uniref:Uncharacterized protein n=2 Tax=Meloidogyne enterolobii TaxID=390850 RepID=A0A6V7VFT1_MELEN|nr:unnamed protein product [Meloidogyne enterolobii]
MVFCFRCRCCSVHSRLFARMAMPFYRFGRPIVNKLKHLLDRCILNFPERTTSTWQAARNKKSKKKNKRRLYNRHGTTVTTTPSSSSSTHYENVPTFSSSSSNNFAPRRPLPNNHSVYSLVRLGDLVRVRNPEDGVSVPNTDEDYYYISSNSGEEDDQQEVTTAIEYVPSCPGPHMKQAVSNVRRLSSVRQTKSCGDLPNLLNVEDDNSYGEYEDEENGTTNNNYSSSYSNDADVSSSCDEEEEDHFYSTRSWDSYDQSSCSESVSYSSYSEESNVSFSTSSATTAFSLVGKTVRVVSFKQSNMRLNPENIRESNVTEVPRSSQHKDESSSQDEYFMATNELSSNSSEMYYSDAVSEEKVVPRLMPEYNLYSTQQEFRNCAVEACNMNTFLQLIECSFPQECSEQILNNLFFDYRQLVCQKMWEEEQQQKQQKEEMNKSNETDCENEKLDDENDDYFWS